MRAWHRTMRPGGAWFSSTPAYSVTAVWRSRGNEPAWVRPALAALTVLAGFFYAWNATGNLEIFYAAAVRSMSMSWHNFVFAAFDPAGTITVDKLPGAFWVQALFVRVFGLHAWAIVAPQVIEGMASVLVLYRVVRRLAGPLAGMVAALVLVVSPATVALNRGNISDTLMVLLLCSRPTRPSAPPARGRWRLIVLAAALARAGVPGQDDRGVARPAGACGRAFCSRRRRRRRRLAPAGDAARPCAGMVAAMCHLAGWSFSRSGPPAHRPYVDGSTANSIFSQVFVYNGFGRLDQASPNQLLTNAIGLRLRLGAGELGPAADRGLRPRHGLADPGGTDRTRRRPDRRPSEQATAPAPRRLPLWGLWLVVLLVAFSASSTYQRLLHGGALTGDRRPAGDGRGARLDVPDRACGPGSSRRRESSSAAAYAVWLLPAHGIGPGRGSSPGAGVLGLGAVVRRVLLIGRRDRR